MQPLLAKMKVLEEREAYGSTAYRGTIGKQEVVLCRCGIATINAALCTSVIIREMGATCIINTGIAGAMGKGVSVLDVVISSEALYHDRHDDILKKYYPFTTLFRADEQLVAAAQKAAARIIRDGEPLIVHTGRIATGDWFVEDPDKKAAINRQFSPLCVEMEGAAIANVAFVNKVPFVVIRTMSDSADSDASISYDQLIEKASLISAEIVLNMLGA